MSITSKTTIYPLLAGLVIALTGGSAVAQESVFSPSLRFTGAPVETLSSGKVIREVAIMRGTRFNWNGKLAGLVADDDSARAESSTYSPPDLAAMSEEELAHALRGVAMFEGHEFVEAEPAYDLARKIKRIEAARAAGDYRELSTLLSPTGPSLGNAQANAPWLEANVPHRPDPFSVHGVDDRDVFNNLNYPYRTNIVYDNTGSTSVINGSEGSGTLIGPSTAMTVAHVFWNEDADTWESPHRWAPGFDSEDADPSPYGEWYRCYWVTIPGGYASNESAYYDYAVMDFDVGCNSVRNGVNSDEPGATVGWLGAYTASTSDIESRTAYVRGYPGTTNCGNPAQP
ncbi:MAG: hypothetical protein AAFX85_16630, partial [Pseudomonadota bacterium]